MTGALDVRELWDFDDPAASEARLRAAAAAATGDDALVLRTQVARALGLRGRFEEATGELAALPADASPLVLAWAALETGRVLRSSGNADEAVSMFGDALATAEQAGADDVAADAAHMLAITVHGEEQVRWARRALDIATASDDPRVRRWIAPVSHNLGWTLHDLGRVQEALGVWQTALEERLAAAGAPGAPAGAARELHVARWTVARGLRSAGHPEEALAIQTALAETAEPDGHVAEEIGELLLALGRDAEAAPHFARAHALLARDARLVEAEPERIARLAELGGAAPRRPRG